MKEYYVCHSKYRLINRKNYDNELTFAFIGKMKDVKEGIYNYYHGGKLIWSEKGSVDLFNYYAEAILPDYFKSLEYPIFKKYSDSCEELA